MPTAYPGLYPQAKLATMTGRISNGESQTADWGTSTPMRTVVETIPDTKQRWDRIIPGQVYSDSLSLGLQRGGWSPSAETQRMASGSFPGNRGVIATDES